MKSLLERAIVHLLNGDEGKASALLHKFMVERARQIHESLRQNDDVDLTENWDQEIKLEEYFDDDVNDDPSADPTDDSVDDDAPEMADASPDMGDTDDMDNGDDMDDVATDDDAMGDGLDDVDTDADTGEDTVEDKIDTLSGKIDDFMAEFDRVMAEFSDEDGIGGDTGDTDAMGDDSAGDDAFGDEDLDNEDMDTDNKGLAGRMETDVADPDDNPEDEIPEDDTSMGMDSDESDLDDITESVLAELDKVSAPANTDGRQSDGKSFAQNKSSVIPGNNNVMDRKGGEPVMTKAKNPARGYARETPPSYDKNNSGSTSKVRKGNVRDHWEETMEKVPADGVSGALLNTDYAAGRKKADSIIPGKKDNSKL